MPLNLMHCSFNSVNNNQTFFGGVTFFKIQEIQYERDRHCHLMTEIKGPTKDLFTIKAKEKVHILL